MATATSSGAPPAPAPPRTPASFKAKVSKRKCSCGNPRCHEVLEKYYFDKSSPFPDPANPQLFVEIRNPSANPSQLVRHQALRQQIYDRAAKLLHVSHGKRLNVAIHHYHRDVISSFASGGGGGKGSFTQYILPSSLVANNRLGVAFTGVDKFSCLETNFADKACMKALKHAWKWLSDDERASLAKNDYCNCGRFVNSPFVTVARADESMMVTSSSSSQGNGVPRPSHHSKTFSELLNRKVCSCGKPECLAALRDHYLDPASPYPDPANPQLIFEIRDPSLNPDTKKPKQAARRGQVFHRAAELLGVDGYRTLRIAVHHFHRDAIRAFADDPNSGRYFLDYLLPSSFVVGSRLGVSFTAADRFHCLGTNAEDEACRRAEDARALFGEATSEKPCECARYLNVPFVTCDAARRCIATTDSRAVATSSAAGRDASASAGRDDPPPPGISDDGSGGKDKGGDSVSRPLPSQNSDSAGPGRPDAEAEGRVEEFLQGRAASARRGRGEASNSAPEREHLAGPLSKVPREPLTEAHAAAARLWLKSPAMTCEEAMLQCGFTPEDAAAESKQLWVRNIFCRASSARSKKRKASSIGNVTPVWRDDKTAAAKEPRVPPAPMRVGLPPPFPTGQLLPPIHRNTTSVIGDRRMVAGRQPIPFAPGGGAPPFFPGRPRPPHFPFAPGHNEPPGTKSNGDAHKIKMPRKICDCPDGAGECRAMLSQYLRDANAPFPDSDGKKDVQLLYCLPNPHKKHSMRKQRKQLYDRVAQVLGVPSPETRDEICIGVHHFHRTVIEHYRANPDRGRTGFLDYLLPPDLVGEDENGKPRLGRHFSKEDLFSCIGTKSQKRGCAEYGTCRCKLHLNLPFVSLDMAKRSLGRKIAVTFPTAEPLITAERINVRKRRCETCHRPCPPTSRDPRAPKRNKPAYLLYQHAMRDIFSQENPQMTFGQVSKLTSTMYHELRPEAKAFWIQREKTDKARYLHELENYNPPIGFDIKGDAIVTPEEGQPAGDDDKPQRKRNSELGQCALCQNIQQAVSNGMDVFEVSVPEGAEQRRTFNVEVNGQKVSLVRPLYDAMGRPLFGLLASKEGAKILFYFPENVADASKVKLKLCKLCRISKPRGSYNPLEWEKRSGSGECTYCSRVDGWGRAGPTQEQTRKLVAETIDLRTQCDTLKRERDDAIAELRRLQGKMGLPKRRKSRKPVPLQEGPQPKGKTILMSDGTRLPSNPPKLTKDGTYAQTTNLVPPGFRWCRVRGLWAPILPRQMADGRYNHPEGGKEVEGFEWDYEKGVWRCNEAPDPKRRRRCKLNPDGTMTPAAAPRLLEDGTYARQTGGRTPKGYEWDPIRGLWAPIAMRDDSESEEEKEADDKSSENEKEKDEQIGIGYGEYSKYFD